MKQIYLDYNASTPIAPEVLHEMQPFLTDCFGNPSSSHWAADQLHDAIEEARAKVAALIGSAPDEIVFTSGASEANNLALKGIYYALRRKGSHIITTGIEHPAILGPARFLESIGAEVTYVQVDEYGVVSPEDIEKAITDRTILISVMHANNETGSIQPIAEIAHIACRHGVYLHSDAAQTIGKIPVRVDELGVDMLSLAGHKFYAPKGIGALYIRKGTSIEPLIHGAGHESGMRAGTENVPYIVGLGKAAELVREGHEHNRIDELGKLFWSQMKAHFQDAVSLNGHPVNRLPNTFNINFHGYSGQEILGRMPEIAASTGSACHSGQTTLSPVLAAMKVPVERGGGAVRISLGRYTDEHMVRAAVSMFKERVPIYG
ncbi:cysteine desulfurase [Cohnella kolymensis]|uniref:cysteine desulfurase n=1 Tax=Cohnella kolymensis TaxID=1590652 RepID=A0ABR5A1G0_9BACL|nr:cysteine desulfurase [Cohnella kolymensis]